MKQKQRDKFRRLYNEFSEEKCWDRAEKSAKHLLTAVSFKESSSSCFAKTKSVLLPPIGLYYSMFHMTVSLCWLNPEIKKNDLRKIKHSSLQNLIESKFVQQKIIDSSFAELLNTLKEEREWLNYSFGEYNYDFFENMSENILLIEREFDIAFEVMTEICTTLRKKFDIKQRISTYIADSKGEDLLQTYLEDKEQDIVMDYIANKGFSN